MDDVTENATTETAAVEEAAPVEQVQAVAVDAPADGSVATAVADAPVMVEAEPAALPITSYDTAPQEAAENAQVRKYYADGSTALGSPDMPDVSPDGARAVTWAEWYMVQLGAGEQTGSVGINMPTAQEANNAIADAFAEFKVTQKQEAYASVGPGRGDLTPLAPVGPPPERPVVTKDHEAVLDYIDARMEHMAASMGWMLSAFHHSAAAE